MVSLKFIIFYLIFFTLIYSFSTEFFDENDKVNVVIKYEGKDLEISFPPGNENAEAMAKKFCNRKISSDQLMIIKQCIQSMSEYLKKKSDEYIEHLERKQAMHKKDVPKEDLHSNKTLSIKLEANGKIYEIDINYSIQNPKFVATEFCKKNLIDFGLVESEISYCVEPLLDHLEGAIAEQKLQDEIKISDKLLNVQLSISGQDFDLNIDLSKETPELVAQSFCQENLLLFGIEDSEIANCINPVAHRISQAIKQSINQN